MSEKDLCNSIVEFLNYHGCYVWRTNSGAVETKSGHMVRLNRKGTSDILGLRADGRFIAIEVKLPKTRKNVTVWQQGFLDMIKQAGGIAGVATSPEEALEIVRLRS